MNDKWYNSEFAGTLGMGIMLFLVSCGVGTCTMLENVKIEHKQDPAEKIVNRILDTNSK